MKRKAVILVAAAVIVLGAVLGGGVYAFRPFATVDYASFEPRFADAVRSTGLQIRELATVGGEQAPVPWNIRWRLRSSDTNSGVCFAIGFPDCAEHFQLAASNGASFDCWVRYLDSRATIIAIRARPAQAAEARTLRSTLAREFPGLTITLTVD